MEVRKPLVLILAALASSCSSEEKTPAPSSSDASSVDATPADAGAPGETCIGYGTTGDSCGSEQGRPNGYVCFGGPPPGIDDCKLTRESDTLGNNYCCAANDCVEQIDQGAQCSGVSGKPHRFQCPPGSSAPPSGCVEHGSGSTAVEKYYCCP